ncbi:hypothetical protein COT44_01515 [Candidatus Shapirobacteria bacterium CG08_land_8_20_14_0_20_39_18]|uniref:DUF5673 domain-containing protein n=1 Tax=Candidatus Shapirobacteria bacterium CG08_land_8_20_14_0_20_39_18 TaxID=1974883 RepID=A0A2M6XDL8_9BACT|nr:MAG: hypothetical protein COT44_01515 [Candidatus Shapirobacteria bacterium CG08_land_8_20_14_0_20_39_18]PIY65153.1 MAG: hypothetical protein COY91_03775 [Candidatus Shapirobacteria bacterium CG_4_10_14_0_8_um_filter_39_15]PJE68009.1 MAG: hypothetical protein COU94_04210 [Candidatus Shapirobacteria bacterium CG10_big_fil_rev_8_21_14_0_10_38_8]
MAVQTKSTLTEQEPLEVTPVRQIKILFSWKAPSRPFKRQSKEFWTTVGSIAFLLGLIFALLSEWLLILVCVSVIFVYYVFSTVPPELVEHQITNFGIRFAGRDYYWEQLSQFWTTEKWGSMIINVGLRFGFVRSFQMLATEEEMKTIKEILKKYLPEEALPPTFTDKAATWLSEKIPLEIS